MDQSPSSQGGIATTNIQNEIVQHRTSPDAIIEAISSLRNEIAGLREDRAKDKEFMLDLQRKVNSLSQCQVVVKGRTFTIFPRLPPELCNKVWRIALGVPRVVPVKICSPNTESSIEIPVPTTPTHPLLRTSHESRLQSLEVLCCYTRDYQVAPKLFLNPHIDTLWVINYGSNLSIDGPIHDWHFIDPDRKCTDFKLAISCEPLHSKLISIHEERVSDFAKRWHRNKIEEIILIVGSTDMECKSELVLINPRERPEATFGGSSNWIDSWRYYNESMTWFNLEERTALYVKGAMDVEVRDEDITKGW
jgi:hypothetical protein